MASRYGVQDLGLGILGLGGCIGYIVYIMAPFICGVYLLWMEEILRHSYITSTRMIAVFWEFY